MESGLRGVLNGREPYSLLAIQGQLGQIHGPANYPVMLRGAADRCRVYDKSRSLNGDVQCQHGNQGSSTEYGSRTAKPV